ncbi:MAG: radical SAM protein [Holophagales bacterium]|nr:MAG: radical SAM protein [Holophagales bacterium]
MICRMIFDELCVHANGDLVCSCADPPGRRVFGNVHRDRIDEVYNGPLYRAARSDQLAAAGDSYCPVIESFCGGRVSRPTADDQATGRVVRVLQLEPISRCNLRCPECPTTSFGTHPAFRGDRAAVLPLAVMLDVVAQLPYLEKILFYNFGEPFLHPQAIDFLREVRRRRPEVTIHTSTNGLALSRTAIEAIAAEALLDRIVFSIDGARESSYRRYRVGGSLSKALAAMRLLLEALDAHATRRRVEVLWQYILFTWNDSEAELAAARELAGRLGVRIEWVLTHTQGASRRIREGSDAARRLLGGDDYRALTCDARMASLWRHRGVASSFYAASIAPEPRALRTTPGGRFATIVRIANASPGTWPVGSSRGVRLGVRLETPEGRPIRELPGLPLPEAVGRRHGSGWLVLDGKAPEQPGRYRLFVDLVHEGVAWFSERSSAPAICHLEVGDGPLRAAAGLSHEICRAMLGQDPESPEAESWRRRLDAGEPSEALLQDLGRRLAGEEVSLRLDAARERVARALALVPPAPVPAR